ncbi:MAG: hypothetical protein O8C64_07235 [Candidatus Methanoperedens sp.]|nr:hypothetical protein [Candidatus Methanoperedens sp.]MCZ7405487.1 hypothetical protein [Candidatus Methanoperedens sp.]
MSIIELMLVVFLINLPFGYWRGKANRFSKQWIMAIHIPIPFIFLLRIFSGFGWTVIPLLMISDFLGQFAGGKLRKFEAH